MQRCPGRRREAGACAGHKKSAPASAEKNWRLPLRARSARLRDAQNRGGKPTHRARVAKRPPREIERSSRPSALSRTPRLRDASRQPSIDRSRRRLPTRAPNRRLPRPQPRLPDDRPRPMTRSATGPPTALAETADSSTSAHRTDRGAHCREPAFSETAMRLPPRHRACHRQRRGRARRARDPWPALAFAPSHAGLRLPPTVEPSRRSHRRDWRPTAPRDRGERTSDALPKGRPARTAGSKGARLSARRPLR